MMRAIYAERSKLSANADMYSADLMFEQESRDYFYRVAALESQGFWDFDYDSIFLRQRSIWQKINDGTCNYLLSIFS